MEHDKFPTVTSGAATVAAAVRVSWRFFFFSRLIGAVFCPYTRAYFRRR